MKNLLSITNHEIIELLDLIIGGEYKIAGRKMIVDDKTQETGIEITIVTYWDIDNRKNKREIVDTIILYKTRIEGTYIDEVMKFDFPGGVQRIYQDFLLYKNYKN